MSNEEKYLEPCNFVIRHETGNWEPGSQTVALYATRETMQRMVKEMAAALEKADVSNKDEPGSDTLFFDYAVDGDSLPYVSSISLAICEDLRPFHRLPNFRERVLLWTLRTVLIAIVCVLALIGLLSIGSFVETLKHLLA